VPNRNGSWSSSNTFDRFARSGWSAIRWSQSIVGYGVGSIRCEARGNVTLSKTVAAAAMRPAEVQFATGLAVGLEILSIELTNHINASLT
jgi:hypothetical protein